jgi:hypothetical protein
MLLLGGLIIMFRLLQGGSALGLFGTSHFLDLLSCVMESLMGLLELSFCRKNITLGDLMMFAFQLLAGSHGNFDLDAWPVPAAALPLSRHPPFA